MEADVVLLENEILRILREADRIDDGPLALATRESRLREVPVCQLGRDPVAEVRQAIGDLDEDPARRQRVHPLDLGER
jgi:hypothetical protein